MADYDDDELNLYGDAPSTPITQQNNFTQPDEDDNSYGLYEDPQTDDRPTSSEPILPTSTEITVGEDENMLNEGDVEPVSEDVSGEVQKTQPGEQLEQQEAEDEAENAEAEEEYEEEDSDSDLEIVMDTVAPVKPGMEVHRRNSLVNLKPNQYIKSASDAKKIDGTSNQLNPKSSGTGIDIDAPGTLDGQNILEVDMDSIEDKPWRKPGADVTDYFNYGFSEDTWRAYCLKQKHLREGHTEERNGFDSKLDGMANMPPELQMLAGGHPFDNMHGRGRGRGDDPDNIQVLLSERERAGDEPSGQNFPTKHEMEMVMGMGMGGPMGMSGPMQPPPHMGMFPPGMLPDMMGPGGMPPYFMGGPGMPPMPGMGPGMGGPGMGPGMGGPGMGPGMGGAGMGPGMGGPGMPGGPGGHDIPSGPMGFGPKPGMRPPSMPAHMMRGRMMPQNMMMRGGPPGRMLGNGRGGPMDRQFFNMDNGGGGWEGPPKFRNMQNMQMQNDNIPPPTGPSSSNVNQAANRDATPVSPPSSSIPTGPAADRVDRGSMSSYGSEKEGGGKSHSRGDDREHGDREKEKEKEREKDKDKVKEKERDRERDREKDRDKDRDRDTDRDEHRSERREKERHSSSSSRRDDDRYEERSSSRKRSSREDDDYHRSKRRH